jgi:hypothetical protein
MKEVWKDVVGYEGLYQVSNLGRVKSLSRIKINGASYGFGITKERYLKLQIDDKGYNRVKLHNNKNITTKKVYRLVAEAFIPNPEDKKQVNHIDGNKLNNRVDNLEWATPYENVKHAIDTGLIKYNIHKYKTKILKDYFNNIPLQKIFNKYHITQKSLYDTLKKEGLNMRGYNKYNLDHGEFKKDILNNVKRSKVIKKHNITRGVYDYKRKKILEEMK